MTQERKDRRHRSHNRVTNEEGIPPATSGEENHEFQDAREKLAAADKAIASVLSGDSAQFLENFRQQGGE